MKRFLSALLPLLLVAMMAFTSCAIQQIDPSDIPGQTQPPSESEQQLKMLTEAMDFSDPFSAESTVVLTISEELKLTSTFKVNKEGSCTYSIQRLKPYVQGSTGSDLIETVKGTKKASENPEEGVFVSQLTFDLAYFSDYTMVGVSTLTFTGEVKDDCIDDFLGYALEGTNMVVTIEVESDSTVTSITLNYENAYGAVEVATLYRY